VATRAPAAHANPSWTQGDYNYKGEWGKPARSPAPSSGGEWRGLTLGWGVKGAERARWPRGSYPAGAPRICTQATVTRLPHRPRRVGLAGQRLRQEDRDTVGHAVRGLNGGPLSAPQGVLMCLCHVGLIRSRKRRRTISAGRWTSEGK
jgi:hypothetical protein